MVTQLDRNRNPPGNQRQVPNFTKLHARHNRANPQGDYQWRLTPDWLDS